MVDITDSDMAHGTRLWSSIPHPPIRFCSNKTCYYYRIKHASMQVPGKSVDWCVLIKKLHNSTRTRTHTSPLEHHWSLKYTCNAGTGVVIGYCQIPPGSALTNPYPIYLQCELWVVYSTSVCLNGVMNFYYYEYHIRWVHIQHSMSSWKSESIFPDEHISDLACISTLLPAPFHQNLSTGSHLYIRLSSAKASCKRVDSDDAQDLKKKTRGISNDATINNVLHEKTFCTSLKRAMSSHFISSYSMKSLLTRFLIHISSLGWLELKDVPPCAHSLENL